MWTHKCKHVIGFQVYACILLFVHSLEAFYYFANPRSDSMRAKKELKVDYIVCGFGILKYNTI